MGKKDDKTNVMRVLDKFGVTYDSKKYEPDGTLTGAEIAKKLGQNPNAVFKTLVTVSPRTREHYVFMLPVEAELDLKKGARAVGEKSIEMIAQRELLPLTGYIHGGCSPIGMKKQFKTTIDETAEQFEEIMFSAGRVGFQVTVRLDDLKRVINLGAADLKKE